MNDDKRRARKLPDAILKRLEPHYAVAEKAGDAVMEIIEIVRESLDIPEDFVYGHDGYFRPPAGEDSEGQD